MSDPKGGKILVTLERENLSPWLEMSVVNNIITLSVDQNLISKSDAGKYEFTIILENLKEKLQTSYTLNLNINYIEAKSED